MSGLDLLSREKGGVKTRARGGDQLMLHKRDPQP